MVETKITLIQIPREVFHNYTKIKKCYLCKKHEIIIGKCYCCNKNWCLKCVNELLNNVKKTHSLMIFHRID